MLSTELSPAGNEQDINLPFLTGGMLKRKSESYRNDGSSALYCRSYTPQSSWIICLYHKLPSSPKDHVSPLAGRKECGVAELGQHHYIDLAVLELIT